MSLVLPGTTWDTSHTQQIMALRHEPQDDDERKAAEHTRDWFHDVVMDEDYSCGYGVQRGLAAFADEEFVFGRNEPGVQHFHRVLKEMVLVSGGGTTDIDEATMPAVAVQVPLLDKRVAVITGGSRGIGRGIAEKFLAEGAAVVLGGKSQDKGLRAIEEMGVGDRATFVQCDVRREEDVNNLIDEATKRYGAADILVNNAGGTDGWALVHELSDEAWQNALDWNLNAVFWGTRRALGYMLERGWGRIINISSVEGKQANKPAVSHYITNKHAINGFTKAVAHEYGPRGITCNAICPGAIETDLMKEAGPTVAAAGRHHLRAVPRQLRAGSRRSSGSTPSKRSRRWRRCWPARSAAVSPAL